MTQETIEQTFEVPTPARLKLGNVRGSVVIQPGDEGLIEITAVKHLRTGDSEQTKIEIKQDDDGGVLVETRYREGGFFLLRRKPCKVDYLIRVPADSDLDVSGVSNSASIEGVSGELFISTVSGSLELKAFNGSLNVTAVSGDLRGKSLNGSLNLETVSGDIILVDSNIKEMDVSTVSGDLSVQSNLGGGPYSFNSVSGDVQLILPADTMCTVKSKSISGDLKTNLPDKPSQHSKGQMTLTLGDGDGTQVLHNSISGDFLLVIGEDISEQPSETAAEKGDHMKMLERIERGEISVEEGLRELQS